MEYISSVLIRVLILAMFAISLNLLMGYAGQLSMTHAALGALGGYVAVLLFAHYGFGYETSFLIAVGVAVIVGIIICMPAMRLGPEYMVLMTIALASAIIASINAWSQLGGSHGFYAGMLETPQVPPSTMSIFGLLLVDETQRIIVVGAITLAIFLICWRLGESPFGRVLKGMREDAVAMRALGKNTIKFNIITFALTSGMAGVAGAMLAWDSLVIAPNMFDFNLNTTIITVVVLGGLGNPLGALVGAIVVGLFSPIFEHFVKLDPGFMYLLILVLYGALLVVVLRLRPQGLLPEGSSFRKWNENRRQKERNSGKDAGSRGIHTAGGQATMKVTPVPGSSVALGIDHQPEDGSRVRLAMEVRGLVKSFGGLKAVNGLDFDLPAGQIIALIGPNGAGKTTVFNLVTGALPLDSGKVCLWGKDITGLSPDQVAGLGMVRSFQDVRLILRMTALENVMLAIPHQPGEGLGSLFFRPRQVRGFEKLNRERAQKYLSFVGLDAKADFLTGELGYGEQKLISLARILATGADVLLLDEPASGIDKSWLEPTLEVILRLPQLGKTVLVVEHNLEVVRALATKTYFLEQGKITASGTMEELVAQERLAEVYFGRIN